MYACPIDIPEAPEGASELSPSEIIAATEPNDVNTVWVISRLSGSEDVVSLRTSSGTFLTATPSGNVTASTPSRGPLEAFKPLVSTSSSPFPCFALQTSSEKYLSIAELTGVAPGKRDKYELRADSDEVGEGERVRIKCQREFVLKAKMTEGMASGKRRVDMSGGGNVEDEVKRK